MIEIKTTEFEGVQYIKLPKNLDDASLPTLRQRLFECAQKTVPVHVIDFAMLTNPSEKLLNELKAFSELIR